MEALWKAPLAILELLGILILAAIPVVVIGYLTLVIPFQQNGCHESPQNHRIVCQTEPIKGSK